MKTLLKIFWLSIFSIFLMQPVQGQKLLNRLKQKVEQKIDERVEKKVEEEIDTKLEEGNEENSSERNDSVDSREDKMEQRMQGMLKGLGISSEPVTIADSYRFDQMIQMHMESYDEKGEKTDEGEFITHLNPKTKSMAYQMISGDIAESGQGMFIIDTENSATIILSEENGKKTGIVYGMEGFLQSMGETYDETELEETSDMYLANPNVKKTGKTKTIAGYKCEEYVFSDEETVSNIWITKDLKMNTQDYFSTLFKTSMYSHGMPWGYTMEVITENKSNKEKSIMKVTDIDTNSNVTFSMSNYEITNLGSFQMPVEE